MGGAMMGPMGVVLGVSLAVSLLPKLIDWLSATDDSTSKANTELEKMRDLLERISKLQFEIGETSEKQRRDKLEVDLDEAERAFKRASAAARGKELKVLREAYGPGVGAGSFADVGKDTPEYQAVLEAKKALFEFDKSRDAEKKRAIKEQTDELKKQNTEYEKQVILTAGQEYGYAKGMSRNMMLGPRGTQISGLRFLGTGGFNKNTAMAGQGGIPMMGGAEYKPPKVVFGEWMSYSMDFQSAFMSGIGSISSSISSQIGGAFASVFGGAKTLLGNFVQMFTQALAEMAIKAAALFAFKAIAKAIGIDLPTPSGSDVGTDSGSIAVGLAQSRTRINNLNINVPEIAARIENDAIVLAYERGKLVRQNRIL
jgi:hypothetical protein